MGYLFLGTIVSAEKLIYIPLATWGLVLSHGKRLISDLSLVAVVVQLFVVE